MIIAQSNVSMAANHQKDTIRTEQERFRAWSEDPQSGQRTETRDPNDPMVKSIKDRVEFSAELLSFSQQTVNISSGYSSLRNSNVNLSQGTLLSAENCDGDCDDDDLVWATDAKLGMMKQIIEALSGIKVKIMNPKELTENEDELERAHKDRMDSADEQKVQGAPQETEREGWGIEYDHLETRVEREHTQFQSEGVVVTADGQQIAFDVNLEMSRERIDVTQFRFRAGDAQLTDPLVVNFNGTAAQLTDEKFGFDLNSDGVDESISFVRSGSGFLVHDKNSDGIVNNGSELFGPSTGDGFQELAGYDEDGNGWIDEADSIYDDLYVWTKRMDGTDLLLSAKEQNVGAIYLQNAITPFDQKSGDGSLNGVTQSTGVYLSEDGQAGTIQQVDLVT